VYSYGMVHFTCVGISSLVGTRGCSTLYNYITMQGAKKILKIFMSLGIL